MDDDDDDDLDKRIRPREACIAVRLMVQNRTSSWRLMFIFHCMTIGMLYLLNVCRGRAACVIGPTVVSFSASFFLPGRIVWLLFGVFFTFSDMCP